MEGVGNWLRRNFIGGKSSTRRIFYRGLDKKENVWYNE
jgi:hypothetical protein